MNASSTFARGLIAGRYALTHLLGTGAHGEVWRADDRVASVAVAVKLFGGPSSADEPRPARIRGEIAALRTLRLPGVVRLLDEGTHQGHTFMVTELIEGSPFPGRPIPCVWEELASVVFDALETLARVHAAGVVHRDLKPGNLLVDRDRRPTLLDFGVAVGSFARAASLTGRTEVVGTPTYLAPEQVTGAEVSPRTDLYALGVMLYEALVGSPPHRGRDASTLLRAKLTQTPPSLLERAAGVPRHVGEVVDRVLAVEQRDRPATATEMSALLRGEVPPVAAEPPWIGSRQLVDDVVRRAMAGVRVRLSGPPGAGKSRTLAEAAAELMSRGRRVAWLRPANHPFGSLAPLFAMDALGDCGLEEARVRAAVAVRGQLGSTTIVVDDVSTLDHESRVVLDAVEGSLVIAGRSDDLVAAELTTAPFADGDLELLFAGPERVHHLPSDAASALVDRTGGHASSVVEEISAWERFGLVRWDDGRIRIDRDALDALDAGVALDVATAPIRDTSHLQPYQLRELLEWIVIAGVPMAPATLAAAMCLPHWRVESDLGSLRQQGLIRFDGQGQVRARCIPAELELCPWETRRYRHDRLVEVLAPGTPGRLLNLLAAVDESPARRESVVDEALRVARDSFADGRLGQARAVLSESVRVLSSASALHPEHCERLLREWVHVALADFSPPPLDRVHYEIARLTARRPELLNVERLVRAALAFGSWTRQPLDLARLVEPFADDRFERDRQLVLLTAARRADLATHELVMDEVTTWATVHDDPETRACVAGWLGRLRYRQGRFHESARLHHVAAEGEELLTSRIGALLNGASALMEVDELREARRRAESAFELAASCRHAFYEARAEWLLRCIAARQGRAMRPDHELVDAVAHLAFPELEVAACVTEAGIAFRTSMFDDAARLAARARSVGVTRAHPDALVLADAIIAACEGPMTDDDLASLERRACASPSPGITAQALALLSRRRPVSPPAALLDRIAQIAAKERARPREVISLDQAVDWLMEPPGRR